MSPIMLRLLDARKKRGISQAELARLAATRQATISLLERGQVRRLDLDVLERIAAALHVTASELLVEIPEPIARPRRK